MKSAFFETSGDEFVPATHARGPWAPDMLHGRLLAGLAARSIERGHVDTDLHVARLTIDLFRVPPLAPVRVATRVARNGRRVRAVDASLSIGGQEVARASALMLRRGERPPGQVWKPPPWAVPAPDEISETSDGMRGMMSWDMRPITPGGFGAPEQRRTWLRELRGLVAGERLSQFVRVAMAADFANPFANSGDAGLQFINADLTLYLSRLPRGEWIGFEVAGHSSDAGVAIGECTLHDVSGVIGHASVSALAQTRLPSS